MHYLADRRAFGANGDGTCTLREAIRSANGDMAIDACTKDEGFDTILLAAGTYSFDLADVTDEDASRLGGLDITSDLYIRGVSAE